MIDKGGENLTQNKLSVHFMCICMAYYMCVIASMMVFQEIVSVKVMGLQWDIAGALIPYVFLYPIAYVVLKVYGYKTIKDMIIAMIIMSLVFVIFCNIMVNLPTSSNTAVVEDHLKAILDSSFRLYMAGLIAMPAGAFTSLYIVRALKQKIHKDYSLYILSTLVGEVVNTLLVFTIGFGGVYTLDDIFKNFVFSALLFKAIAALITTPMAVYGVAYLKDLAKKGKI